MDILLNTPTFILILAFGVTFASGAIKGAVGFGMPMIMISGLSSVLDPELALAALIVPTLFSNVWQSLRQGPAAAIESILKFKVYLAALVIMLTFSAQFVTKLPQNVLLMIIGAPVAFFAILQLVGWRGKLSQRSPLIEAIVGSFAGFMGGMSGVWGPPTVAYLTAVDTPKAEQIRVQGTLYGLGALALVGAHIKSGVLTTETFPLSVAMIIPAMVGMGLGMKIQDRIDQATFRKATLVVLLLAGLNLVRRGLIG